MKLANSFPELTIYEMILIYHQLFPFIIELLMVLCDYTIDKNRKVYDTDEIVLLQQITSEQEDHIAAIKKVQAQEDKAVARQLFEAFDTQYREFIDTGLRFLNEKIAKD